MSETPPLGDSGTVAHGLREQPMAEWSPDAGGHFFVRSAICFEPRDGQLHVFLPPLTDLPHWLHLIGAIEATGVTIGVASTLGGVRGLLSLPGRAGWPWAFTPRSSPSATRSTTSTKPCCASLPRRWINTSEARNNDHLFTRLNSEKHHAVGRRL